MGISSGTSTEWLFVHCSRSNWNLAVLIFAEGGKPENPEKNPRSEDENQQQTQPTYGPGPESNPGHIGGRRVLSPLRHPRSPKRLKELGHDSRMRTSDPEILKGCAKLFKIVEGTDSQFISLLILIILH